jgi:hypothetical protein
MTSDALVAMIERKLKEYGLKKVIPADDLLGKTYRAFHRRKQLQKKFERLEKDFKETRIAIPKNLRQRVGTILGQHSDLRWDDAVQIVLDRTQLDHVRAEKQKAKEKSGDFTDAGEDKRAR